MTSGREVEKLVADLYEEAGYETYIPPLAKYREQDVFGEFDILAKGHGRLEGIQVKSSRDAAGIEAWFTVARVYEEDIAGLRVSFVHRKGNAWRVARTDSDGYQWVYDGRDVSTDDDGPLLEVLRQ